MTDSLVAPHLDFATILDHALRARIEEEADAASPIGARQVADPFVREVIEQLLSSPAYVPVGKLAQMYLEERAEGRIEKARDLDQFLADELSLSPELTVDELRRLRREFAAHHHPDRVGSAERDRATRRMALVNVLIDKALKERKAPRT